MTPPVPTFRAHEIEKWCQENDIKYEEFEGIINILNLDNDYEELIDYSNIEKCLESISNIYYHHNAYNIIRNVICFEEDAPVQIIFCDEMLALNKLKSIYNMRSFL